jgi:hypothetical protein
MYPAAEPDAQVVAEVQMSAVFQPVLPMEYVSNEALFQIEVIIRREAAEL